MFYLKLYRKLIALVIVFAMYTSCSSSEEDDGSNDMDDGQISLTVEGRYTGLLELTVSGEFIRLPVSLTVEETTPTRFSGNFYERADFQPCCSLNPQDGTFTFDYDPSEMTIENFVILVDFNSDPLNLCTGVYRGSGVVEFDTISSIVAEILINDCNVSNTLAKLSIDKIGELL